MKKNESNIPQIEGVCFNIPKDKQQKERLFSLSDKFENINTLNTSIANNLKQIELDNAKFYENAKLIFRKIKNIFTKTINSKEIIKDSRENQFSTSLQDYQRIVSTSPLSRSLMEKKEDLSNSNLQHFSSSHSKGKNRIATESDAILKKNNNNLYSLNQLKKSKNEGFSHEEKKIFEGNVTNLKKNIAEMKEENEILSKKYKNIKKEYQEYKQRTQNIKTGQGQFNSSGKDRERDSKEKNSKWCNSRSISPGINKLTNSGGKFFDTNPMWNKKNIIRKFNTKKDKDLETTTEENTSNKKQSRSKSNKSNKDNNVNNKSILSENTLNQTENNLKLAEELDDFFKIMSELQKANSDNSSKMEELKYQFKEKKVELINLTNAILKSKNNNNLLKSDDNVNGKIIIKENLNISSGSIIPKPKEKKSSNVHTSLDVSEKKKLEDQSKFTIKKLFLLVEKLKDENDNMRHDYLQKLIKFNEEHERWKKENQNENENMIKELENLQNLNKKIEEENKIFVSFKLNTEKELKRKDSHISELLSEKQALNITIQTQSKSLKKNQAQIEKLTKQVASEEKLNDSQMKSQINELQNKYDYVKKLNEEYNQTIEELNRYKSNAIENTKSKSKQKLNEGNNSYLKDQIVNLENIIEAKTKNLNQLTNIIEANKKELVSERLQNKQITEEKDKLINELTIKNNENIEVFGDLRNQIQQLKNKNNNLSVEVENLSIKLIHDNLEKEKSKIS